MRRRAAQAGQERHEEGVGAVAVHHRLDGVGAGEPPHLGHGLGVIDGGDLVAVRLLLAGGQLDAHPEVEQPDVVLVGVEDLQQVGLRQVGREDAAGDAGAVDEEDRPAGPPLVADQPQLDAVAGAEVVDLGRAHPQRPLLAGRRVGIEIGLRHQDTAVGVEQHAGEEHPEAGHAGDLGFHIGRVGDLHRGHLVHEVEGLDVEDPLAHHLALVVHAGVDGHVEGGGLRPELEQRAVVHLLEAGEEVGLPLLRAQAHAVDHVADFHPSGVLHEEVERPFGHVHGGGREGGGRHRAGDAGYVLGLRDQGVEVVGGDGEGKLHGRARLPPLLFRLLVVVLHLGGEITLHRLGELEPQLGGRSRIAHVLSSAG